MMSKQVNEAYKFGSFKVDARERLLSRDGQPIAVTPKTFDTLLVLVRNSGHLMLKDELMKAVWPDSFVEEVNLSQNVCALRRALGDTAQESRYIATVPGMGYRFIAEVQTDPPSVDEQRSLVVEQQSPSQIVIEQTRPWRFPATAYYGNHHRTVFAFLIQPPISSIAVLPLENLSNDPEQEYFVDGLTDEIVTDLAQLPGLRVISRTSTQQYKGSHKILPQLARELNVDSVLEGTVLRADNRIRIRARLLHAPSDRHLWAKAYERDGRDLLTLQTTLARNIADEIRLNLSSRGQNRLAQAHPVDTEADESHLNSGYFWNKLGKAGIEKAVEYFQRAMAEDPYYDVAYALAGASTSGGNHLLLRKNR